MGWDAEDLKKRRDEDMDEDMRVRQGLFLLFMPQFLYL